MAASLLGALFSTFFTRSLGHSWVECTDWDITVDIDSEDFVEDFYGSDGFIFHDRCNGYPRDRKDCSSETWDTCGLGWQPYSDDDDDPSTIRMCRDGIGNPNNDYSETYNEEYPMAHYEVGNMYRILWPAKNHASYSCQGTQRDNEMQLWVNLNTNSTTDINPFPTGELLYSNMEQAGYTLVIDWHKKSNLTFGLRDNNNFDENIYGQVYDNVGIDGVPFQNCPHFCEDTDDAVCYGDFKLPNIFPSDGYYTFIWWWEFKSHEKYSHCYEAWVSGTQSEDTSGSNGDDDTSNYGLYSTGEGGVVVDIDSTSSSDDERRLNRKNNNDDDDDTTIAIVASVVSTACVCCCFIVFIVWFLLKRNNNGNNNNNNKIKTSQGLATNQTTMANIIAVPENVGTNSTNVTDGSYGHGATTTHGTYGRATNGMSNGAKVVNSGHRNPPPPPPKRF